MRIEDILNWKAFSLEVEVLWMEAHHLNSPTPSEFSVSYNILIFTGNMNSVQRLYFIYTYCLHLKFYFHNQNLMLYWDYLMKCAFYYRIMSPPNYTIKNKTLSLKVDLETIFKAWTLHYGVCICQNKQVLVSGFTECER